MIRIISQYNWQKLFLSKLTWEIWNQEEKALTNCLEIVAKQNKINKST